MTSTLARNAASRLARRARRADGRLRRLVDAGAVHARSSPNTAPRARPSACSTSRTWAGFASTAPAADVSRPHRHPPRRRHAARPDPLLRWSPTTPAAFSTTCSSITCTMPPAARLLPAGRQRQQPREDRRLARTRIATAARSRRSRRHHADTAMIAVQGPAGARDRAAAVSSVDPATLRYYHGAEAQIAGARRASSAAPATRAKTAAS